MFKLELTFPMLSGLKLMWIVQFAPGPTMPVVVPAGIQVFVRMNDLSKVVTPVMVSGVVPLFFKVTAAETLLVPIIWLPNATLVGDKLTAVPVPVK
jgi:hypothetical protein